MSDNLPQVSVPPTQTEGVVSETTPSSLEPKELSPIEQIEKNFNLPADDPTYDPSMSPLALVGLYSGRWMAIIEKLSNKQLRRVLNTLVLGQMEGKKINHKNQLEKEVFIMGDRILESIYALKIFKVLEEEQERMRKTEEQKGLKQQEANAKVVEGIVSEIVSDTNNGVKNG
jgi:hypothetical protein